MAFDNVRLPVDVEKGVKGGPRFMTTIITLANSSEQRNQDWSEERYEGDISYGIQSREDAQSVSDFFRARRGRARGFRFKDWSDYKATLTFIGTANGALTIFQTVKTYTSGVSYTRKITRIVAGTFQLYKAGILVDPSLYSVNVDTGVITFTAAPSAGTLTASYEFDIPVRFDDDKLDIEMETDDAVIYSGIPIVGIKE
jgi:uncharacterized protein (TIGR02217 family)